MQEKTHGPENNQELLLHNPELVPTNEEQGEREEDKLSSEESAVQTSEEMIAEKKEEALAAAEKTPEWSEHKKEEGTAFTPAIEKSDEKPSWFKKMLKKTGLQKAATVAAITAASVLPAKAQGQQKMSSDKDVIKTEVGSSHSKEIVTSNLEEREITTKNKIDYNKYIDTLEALGLKGSPRLNNIAFSKKVMHEFIKNNPGTTVSEELVQFVQVYLKTIKQRLDAQEAEMEKQGESMQAGVNVAELREKIKREEKVKPATFMDYLDNTINDGIVGEFTSRYKFPQEKMTVTEIVRVHGKDAKGDTVLISEDTKTHTEDHGFSTLASTGQTKMHSTGNK